jgi:hypothetical protein
MPYLQLAQLLLDSRGSHQQPMLALPKIIVTGRSELSSDG